MRVATWNINGIRARLDFLLVWLADRKPDVVGLQELKTGRDSFPAAALWGAGYHSAVHCQAGWNGVAVLSRQPVETRCAGLPGGEDQGARLLTVETLGLSFTTVYVPNGKSVDHADFAAKLDWLDGLARYTAEHLPLSGDVVVAGDFNLCPAELDTYDEATLQGQLFHTGAERTRWRNLLDLGLHDMYREHRPHGRDFTWWDYRAGAFHKGLGLRIDLLLGSDRVRRRLRDVTIDRDYRKKHDGLIPSDHAPVWVDLA
jgi:exodeoxyribonuclease-3